MRGGKRAGAGRKPGSPNKKTQELQRRVAATGVTPLEVMLEAMRDAYAKENLSEAHAFAKDAAPYLHPKLAAVEHTGGEGGPIQFEAIKRVVVDPRADD